MQGKLRAAACNIGRGIEVSGTEDVPRIHKTIAEGIVGLMTEMSDAYVDIWLRDGEVISCYRLTVERVVRPEEEMTFKLVKIPKS